MQRDKENKTFCRLYRVTKADGDIWKGSRNLAPHKCGNQHPSKDDRNHIRGEYFGFFKYFFQRCFICRLSDSAVSENAGIEPSGGFLVFDADVFNLWSFDLPPSIQSHSPLCIATQITDYFWSEESFLSLISFHFKIHVAETERRAQVRPTCSIYFEQQESQKEPQVNPM